MTDSGYIELGNGEVFNFITNQIDSLTSGRKGRVFTEAVILSEIAKNPIGLRSRYQANREILDSYFEEIDLNKLANKIGQDHIQKATQKTVGGFVGANWIPFTVGVGVGAALLLIANRKTRK